MKNVVNSGNADIYGQILDSDGNRLFDEEGLAIGFGNNDQQAPTISYNEVHDEFIVCWEDFTGVDFNLICKTIDNNSLALSDAIVLCDDPSNQKSPFVFSTNDGSYLFAWEDTRSSQTCSWLYC